MKDHKATIDWEREGARFTDNRYSRAHTWKFDGGQIVPGSSSPHVVPVPMSDASAVDPEEAFVAALTSCHMLSFLYVAYKAGLVVDSYHDDALGKMTKNADGRWMVGTVTLRPRVVFSEARLPSSEEIHDLHHQAHVECFIANSVKTQVECEPSL